MTPAQAAQLHLALNHLPVVGVPLGAAVLAWGLRRQSEEVVEAALWLVALTGLSAAVVYWSGLRVGDFALDWPGVDPEAVNAHFRAAKITAAAAIGTGLLAVFAALRPLSRKAALVVLAAAFAVTGLAGRAAHLGGLIRHTELK